MVSETIHLYTASTFNGRKISVALEELELDYQVHKINLRMGEHLKEDFLEINPTGRIPAIIDEAVSPKVVLNQSFAILLYLAEKSKKLLPDNTIERAEMLEWLSFFSTDISTALFDAFYLNSLVRKKQAKAAELLRQRVVHLCRFLDHKLQKSTFIIGDSITIADVAAYPVMDQISDRLFDKNYTHIERWHQMLANRPAVQRGMEVPK